MVEINISSNAEEIVKELQDEIERSQKALEFQIFRALTLIEAEILQNLRSRSGLHVRSGALLNSVSASKKVYRDGNDYVVGEIGTQGVPYARIHEFGGKTAPHVIVPRVRKALSFIMGGNKVVVKSVNHPGSTIPARPYLRPALAATQDKIVKEFGLFLKASFPGMANTG